MTEIREPDAVRRSGSRSLEVAVGVWTALVLLFISLAVLASLYDRFPSDEFLAHRLQDVDVPAFGAFLDFVNTLGTVWVVVPLTLALAGGLAFRRAWPEAVVVLLTFVPRYLNSWVKDIVERPRPPEELVEVTEKASGLSFPSGHTVGTAALFGMLIFVLTPLVPWGPARLVLRGGALVLIVAAGPARVYEGVHWPSDVLGGYLLALLVMAPVLLAYRWLRKGIPQ